MSWSIKFFGHPDKVIEALEAESNKLSGESKVEYDAALPHIVGLVKQNYNDQSKPLIQVDASGHGYSHDGKSMQRNCKVVVDYLYGTLCL